MRTHVNTVPDPTAAPGNATTNPVTVLVHKTINSVLQNSRKIIFRVCEATNVKRKFKMFNMYSAMNRRNQEVEKSEQEYTGHDRFYQERTSRYVLFYCNFFFFNVLLFYEKKNVNMSKVCQSGL